MLAIAKGGGIALLWGISLLLRRRGLHPARAAIVIIPITAAADNLVKFAAIQPHAPAGRAIIDFGALPFCHGQHGSIDGAGHRDTRVGHEKASFSRGIHRMDGWTGYAFRHTNRACARFHAAPMAKEHKAVYRGPARTTKKG